MSVEFYLRSKHHPNVCDVFHAVALDTWERIKFSRSNAGMKVHETAITQNMIYEMRLLKHAYSTLPFTLYESRYEKSNGSDLLLRVQHTSGKVYTYAVQAKIIYHDLTSKKHFKLVNGRYVQLKHMVSKGKPHEEPQVEKLLRYGRKRGFIPLYLFYNYVSYDYKGTIDRQYGCSVANAFTIRSKYTDPKDKDLRDDVRFSVLHKHHAFPWEDLVCALSNLNTDEIHSKFNLPNDFIIREGSLDDLSMDERYVDMLLDDKTSALIDLKVNLETKGQLDIRSKNFNPKYIIEVEQQLDKQQILD